MENIRTSDSVFWKGLTQFGSQFISIVFTLILVRLLDPSDFGLFAFIMVFVGIAQLIASMGIDSAVIYARKSGNALLSSLFWLSFLMGIILTTLLILFAPIISDWVGSADSVLLIKMMSLSVLLVTTFTVPKAIFYRDIRFKDLMVFNLSSAFISGLIALAAIYIGLSYFALVIQYLAKLFLMYLFYWLRSGWRPGLFFNIQELRKVMRFSVSVGFSELVSFISNNIDYYFIQRFFGSHSLGLYQKSFSFTTLPSKNIGEVLSDVMFPVIMAKDKAVNLTQTYQYMIRVVSFLAIPLMVYLTFFATPFTLVLFGEKWSGMVLFVRIFSLMAIPFAINSLSKIIYKAKGASKVIFRDVILRRGIIVAFIIIGAFINIEALVLLRMIAEWVGLVITFIFCKQLLEMPYFQQWKQLLPAVLCSIPGTVITWLFFNPDHIETASSPLRLVFSFSLFTIIYTATLFGFYRKDFDSILLNTKQILSTAKKIRS